MSTLKDMETQREQLQGQREEQFAELGKFVYEHFRKEEFDAVLTIVKSLEELDASIAEADTVILQKKEELQRKQDEMHRKGLMICPNCQAEISDKSIFCNICGTKVEGLAEMPELIFASEEEPTAAEEEEAAEEEPEAEEAAAEEEPEAEEAAAEEEPEAEETATEEEPEKEQISESVIDLDAYSDAVVRQVEQKMDSIEPEETLEEPEDSDDQETTLLNSDEEKPIRICRKCGKPVGDGYLFCIYCGTKYEEAQPTPQHNASASGLCPNCGTMNKPGYVFCIRCGTKLV